MRLLLAPQRLSARDRARSRSLFLGLFFLLYPLLKVFGASILDASGKALHARELRQRCCRAVLPQRPDQQPRHAARPRPCHRRWSACRSPSASRGCRSPASRRCWRWPRCRWCCRPSSAPMRSCCCSAAPASSPRAARDRHPLRARSTAPTGIVAVYALTLYPYVAAADARRLQGGRRLGRGGRAEPRLLALRACCAP